MPVPVPQFRSNNIDLSQAYNQPFDKCIGKGVDGQSPLFAMYNIARGTLDTSADRIRCKELLREYLVTHETYYVDPEKWHTYLCMQLNRQLSQLRR
jgi:hypothetical protein